MIKIHLKNTFLILLCLAFIFLTAFLSGCGKEQFTIYFGVEEKPYNLDPQKAESYGELLAVKNCFKGLFKEDAEGNIVPDLAKTFTESDDKLTYTIGLNEAKWSDETIVTADDFVFAVERAKDEATASPSKNKVENIESITASDSKTLIIKLYHPDTNLKKLLATAVFKPCRRVFFVDCKGKYGLTQETLLTNGNYTVSQWNERQIRLTLAKDSSFDAAPKHIYISVSSTGKNSIERINDKEIGMAINSVNDWSSVDTSQFNVSSKYSKTYALIFNKNTEIGGNEKLTSAFAKAVHKEYYSVKMSQRFAVPKSIITDDSLLNETQYQFQFDPDFARTEFLEALQDFKDKKLPTISVLTAQNSEINAILNDIVSQWQSNLGVYVNISTLSSEKTLLENVKSGSFTVALVPLEGTAEEICKNFSDPTSVLYLNNTEFDKQFNALSVAENSTEKATALNACTEILSNDSAVIPVVSVPTSYIYQKTYENVVFSAIDGTVDFTFINKSK